LVEGLEQPPNNAARKVVIAGYYGFDNAGDEAILSVLVNDLRRQSSSTQIVVVSGDPEKTSATFQVRSVEYRDICEIISEIQTCNLVILGGGGLFHDYWGFDPTKILARDYSNIAYYSTICLLATILEKPLMLYGVGVGPLFERSSREHTRLAFEQASRATVRDVESRDLLVSCGLDPARVEVSADPAFRFEPAPAHRVEKILEAEGFEDSGDTVIGISLRDWSFGANIDHWTREVAKGLDLFLDHHKARAIFIPFQNFGTYLTDDLAISLRVIEQMRHKARALMIRGEYSVSEKAGIIASSDVVVGMRLHSIIFAASAAIPVVGLVYDEKVRACMGQLGIDRYAIDLRAIDAEGLQKAMEQAREQRAIISEQLETASAELRLLSEKSSILAEMLLNQENVASAPLSRGVQDLLRQTTLSLATQMEEKERIIQALEPRVADREQVTRVVTAQMQDRIEELEKGIQAREEGIAWLKNEIALLQNRTGQIMSLNEVLNEQLADSEAAQQTLLGQLQTVKAELSRIKGSLGWRLLSRYGKVKYRYLLPLYKRLRPSPQAPPSEIPPASPRSGEGAAATGAGLGLVARETKAPLADISTRAEPARKDKSDFYASLTLLPHLQEQQVGLILNQQPAPASRRLPDVICLAIIDWEFRYQRPQQIMSQFAANGHRVFYVSPSRFQPSGAAPRISVSKIKERVYEVQLAALRQPDIYGEVIEGDSCEELLESLGELRRTFMIDEAIGYVMIASWGELALRSQQLWGWRIIYDCMDEWENFPGIKPPLLEMERRLVRECDLLAVTARRLWEKWQGSGRPMVLARNGVDFDFYAARCQPNDLLADAAHPVVGYYGAIADWFDLGLMTDIARRRPDYTFVLLGGIFDLDVSELRALPNVRLLGQQPYEHMPRYLYHFDTCIIPFKNNPITDATDPVKVYEYLSGGKPVVSVALPELDYCSDYISIAGDREDFLIKLDEAVADTDPAAAERRRQFARQQTWQSRYEAIRDGLASVTPQASIVVVTYNNLPLNRLCLESIIRNTEYPNYEIIVVDNASEDGTPVLLRYMESRYSNIKIILNQENRGFAAANNQGLARATGEYFVLLNNDTVVPPGWLSRLLSHLRTDEVGMVGPVTNFVGNEAKILAPYSTWGEMEDFARRHSWQHDGQVADIHMLAMFCAALRRDTFEAIGPLDEQFGIGMFEDDDYSQRMKAQGYRVICAADAFVHHFGQAAFKKLIEKGDYNPLFEENRRRYETKWNVKWVPHKHESLDFRPLRPFGSFARKAKDEAST
jgi:polysaccharide pyruvyl transferase CsaB